MAVFLFFFLSQPTPMPGWPIPLPEDIWYGDARGVKAFDFDGDGQKELVVAAGNDSTSFLAVFRIDGSFYPGWPQPIGPPPLYASHAVAIGDIDGDGVPEIVVGSGDPRSGQIGRLYAFEPDGSLQPGFPKDFPCTIDHPVTLSDLNGDGIPEILLGCHGGTTVRELRGYVYVMKGDG